MRLRKALMVCAAVVLLSSITTLAIASHRIVAEQSAFSAPASGKCQAEHVNVSAVLPATNLAVTPLPGSRDALPQTQISMLGAPSSALSDIHVVGSRTGVHPGSLRAYSQGDGASFVPKRAFKSGETVTVRGSVSEASGAHSFAYHFVVATRDVLPYKKPTKPSLKDPEEWTHFHTRPELKAALMDVTTNSPSATPGDIFAAPYSGPAPPNPAIYDASGDLIWSHKLPATDESTNLQVQTLDGKPVLTWWQGYIPPQGFGEGEEQIYDSSYRRVATVHAGNGDKVDLHDFKLTPQGTALYTSFQPLDCDLSSVGGPPGGAATDTLFQEVDLKTGLVRREWHALDHVPLSYSVSSGTSSSHKWPFDYFHLNSINQLANGRTLISSRNTSALYELNTITGQVLTRIGGKHSTVKLGSGASTAYQHDATTLASGAISVFDNGGVPKVHSQSRGLVISVDTQNGTDNVIAQYLHPKHLSSGSQGNVQPLENGNFFIGWGANPYFSEFSPSGTLLYDAHLHGSYESYRGYRFAWTGEPAEAPAIASSNASSKSKVTVYASWNGDTRTASWQVLAGTSSKTLAPVASAARTGFETKIVTPGPEPFVAVQALGPAGEVLGASRTIIG
ncbi:MAG TPA: arylsulfotransferase family protein [Solirubrobacteraceae bacterium]|jgi:hypothetical protein|nr:arylsulfotransferase family protein [Solirubrobacteraceae bacterium]